MYICTKQELYFSKKKEKEKKKKGGILTSTRHMVLPRASPCGDFSLHFVVSVKFGETDRWNSKKMSFEVHICGIWGGVVFQTLMKGPHFIYCAFD